MDKITWSEIGKILYGVCPKCGDVLTRNPNSDYKCLGCGKIWSLPPDKYSESIVEG